MEDRRWKMEARRCRIEDRSYTNTFTPSPAGEGAGG
jgi:hypothetical protein